MSYIEEQIDKLLEKKNTVGLTVEEYESLCEYEGRLESIEWETRYFNGEVY